MWGRFLLHKPLFRQIFPILLHTQPGRLKNILFKNPSFHMIQLSDWSMTARLCEETDAYSSQRTTRESFPSWKKGLHSQMKFVCAPSSNAKVLTILSQSRSTRIAKDIIHTKTLHVCIYKHNVTIIKYFSQIMQTS